MIRILLIVLVVISASCEKSKITYNIDSSSIDTIITLPIECEVCHNGSFPEHSTNAHSKHTSGLYNYVCSTCHFEHGYETTTHMNGEKNITFAPNGLATRNGLDSITPIWNATTKTCSNVYCHSNGVSADRGSDSTFTWSTNTPPFGTLVYSTTPNWDSGKITDCSFCHNGLGNMVSPYMVERPNTLVQNNYPASGQHQASFHMSNNQDFSGNPYSVPYWDGVQCFWCHNPTEAINDSSIINNPIFQGTYGTVYHVDGETFFKPVSVSAGGTMANGMSYSSDGAASHCGNGLSCW